MGASPRDDRARMGASPRKEAEAKAKKEQDKKTSPKKK
jgi:hypothetical protein